MEKEADQKAMIAKLQDWLMKQPYAQAPARVAAEELGFSLDTIESLVFASTYLGTVHTGGEIYVYADGE